MRGGSQTSGGHEAGGVDPVPAGSAEDLRQELQAVRNLARQQEREVEKLRLLAREMQEHVRLSHHLRESQLETEARALDQVVRLRGEFLEKLEALASDLDDSRRAFRQSSTTAASVVGRLEARLTELAGQSKQAADLEELRQGLVERFDRLDSRMDEFQARLEAVEALPGRVAELEKLPGLLADLEGLAIRTEALEALPARLAALQERVAEVDTLPSRLEALEAAGAGAAALGRLEALEGHLASLESGEALDERVAAAIGPLEGRLASQAPEGLEEIVAAAVRPLEERLALRQEDLQDMFDVLDLSGVTQPIQHRLEVLAEEFDRLRRKGVDPRLRERVDVLEAQGLAGRVDRLDKEMRRHAERLDEELEAVFEQNRFRVAEMTDAFDTRMELLEAAAERVRELEESTVRSRAETGQVLQAAFERLEVLTGKLGQLEHQVTAAPGPGALAPPDLHELRGAVTHLQSRLHFLEGRPRHSTAALDPEELRSPRAASVGEDPEEGLVPADVEPAAHPPAPAGRPPEGLEKLVRDLEVRAVEQSLEAVTEARLLREEYERLAGHLEDMTASLDRHFAEIWSRLEQRS